MQPTQRLSRVNLHTQTLSEKQVWLMSQREKLFVQQRELLERRAELEQQQQQLITRRTVHELQCRLFWLRLKKPAFAKQEDEAETTATSEPLPV